MTEKAYDLVHYLLVSANEGATTSHPAFRYLCDYIEDLERTAQSWDAHVRVCQYLRPRERMLFGLEPDNCPEPH